MFLCADGKKKQKNIHQEQLCPISKKYLYSSRHHPWGLGRPINHSRPSRGPPVARSHATTKCWVTTRMRPPRPPASVHQLSARSARETPTTRPRTRPRSGRKSPRAPRRLLGSASTRPTGMNIYLGVTGRLCLLTPLQFTHEMLTVGVDE